MKNMLLYTAVMFLVAIDVYTITLISNSGSNMILFSYLILFFSFFMFILLGIEFMERRKK